MSFFDLTKISEKNLQDLIDNKVFENKELDYKDYTFSKGKMEEKDKTKLAQEIVAFANADGGTIVIGIQEDDNRLPTAITGAGFTLKEYDNWLSSCRQLILSRIRPHLHGIEYTPVELSDETIAIIISIPKSFARPHSFWDGNKDTFYIRYANGKSYMDIDDLRKQFLNLSYVQSQIKQFRNDRISQILANESIGDVGAEAKIVIHIIPEWSFELGNIVDLQKVERNPHSLEPISGDSWDDRYNADGFCMVHSEYDSDLTHTYTQIFHNGTIEAVEIRLFSRYKEKQVYNWNQTQGAIIEAIGRYGKLLQTLGVPKPWHIYATILNAKGYNAESGWGSSQKITQNIVNSLDGIWKDDNSLDYAVKPIFDSLSNAFGFSHSSCFDENGKLKKIE